MGRLPPLKEVVAWQAQAISRRGEAAKQAGQRLKEVNRLETLLPPKRFLGRNVPKHLIPKRFTVPGVTDLFRNDLPDGWRLPHSRGRRATGRHRASRPKPPDSDALFGYAGR